MDVYQAEETEMSLVLQKKTLIVNSYSGIWPHGAAASRRAHIQEVQINLLIELAIFSANRIFLCKRRVWLSVG